MTPEDIDYNNTYYIVRNNGFYPCLVMHVKFTGRIVDKISKEFHEAEIITINNKPENRLTDIIWTVKSKNFLDPLYLTKEDAIVAAVKGIHTIRDRWYNNAQNHLNIIENL